MTRLMTTCDQGLRAFTVEDLCHPASLAETVTAKLGALTPGRFLHDRLEHGVRVMLGIIQDAVCGAYRGLNLQALADFLGALDYFLKWRDRVPDTWDGGYVDDLEEVVKVLARHSEVVAHYHQWLAERARAGDWSPPGSGMARLGRRAERGRVPLRLLSTPTV